MPLSQLSFIYSNNMVRHTAYGAWQSPNPSAFLTWQRGVSIPGLVPANDTVSFESMMAITPCDSRVVIGYQVDEYTHTWPTDSLLLI